MQQRAHRLPDRIGLWGCRQHWISAGLLLLITAGGLRAQSPSRSAAQAKLAPAFHAATTRQVIHTVRVSVADKVAFQQWMRQHLPTATVSQPTASARILTVGGLTAAALPQLAATPLVQFVDVPDRRAREERKLNNSDLSVNAIAAVHARFPALAGQGLTVSVKERPFDPNDIDLKGRVGDSSPFAGAPSEHATTMATLIGGAGNSGPSGRGVAGNVRLVTSDFAHLLPDDGQQLAQAGVSVQNHSYGVDIENYYGLEAQEYDRQTQQYPTLVHVFSSGNVGSQASSAGPYGGIPNFANLTGQFKMSKNTLTVGATNPSGQVAALSSRGPAYDGRVKPELVAYGEGGSSEAAALVSGIAVLVQQAYRDQHSGGLPPSSLVKAVLLNSADDLGRPEVDFVSGFGQADALGAVQTMRNGRFFGGAVSPGAEQVFTIAVPPGQQQLKATLAWTDPEAAANAPRALINDLDLELILPATGQRWQPWVLSAYPSADSLARPARRGPDHLNNVEQITLALPAAGAYELHVRGREVLQGSQAFSLAYEASAPELEWLNPLGPTNVQPGAPSTLRWQWSGPPATARLEYQLVGRPQWRVINPIVALEQKRFSWAVPDTTALAQLRLVADSQVFISDTFVLVQAPAVRVGYTCDDETLLQWTRVPGATAYHVYQLGATTLVPFAQTADTAVVLSRGQMQTLFYAVAPVVGGKIAASATTIDFRSQGTGCYFRSFLPRQLVDEAIEFGVELGSVYRLRSATLERLGSNGYVAVQTIAPVPRTAFAFTDLPPAAGRYLYRVRLDNVAGQQFYSDPEEAYLLRAGSVQAFPNPVQAGEALSLAANTAAPVAIQLYDMLGRLQREETVAGVINQFNTSGLKPGLYLMRMRTEGHAEQIIRVIIR